MGLTPPLLRVLWSVTALRGRSGDLDLAAVGDELGTAEVDGALIDNGVDLDQEAVAFGQPTRQIGAVIDAVNGRHP